MKFLIKNKKVFKGIIEVLIGCCCVGEVASLLLDKESIILTTILFLSCLALSFILLFLLLRLERLSLRYCHNCFNKINREDVLYKLVDVIEFKKGNNQYTFKLNCLCKDCKKRQFDDIKISATSEEKAIEKLNIQLDKIFK